MEEWVACVEAGLPFEKHSQVLTIKYEDLINNYEKTIRKLLEFLGEEFHESFLSYPENAKLKFAHQWINVNARPVHNNSIGRWKEKGNEDLTKEFMNNEQAVKLLKHYNYI